MNWREWLQRSYRLLRIACAVVLAVVLVMAGYQLYTFYHDKLGDTPAKTIEAYFTALGQQDYDEVYRLTDKAKLCDLQGRPVTRADVITQLRAVTGNRAITFTQITSTRLFRQGDSYYFRVELTTAMSSGSSKAELLVEVRRELETWVVTYPFGIVY